MSSPTAAEASAPPVTSRPPSWLPTLLTTPFYGTCPAHASLRRADLNLFDTETCATLCQHCVASNPSCQAPVPADAEPQTNAGVRRTPSSALPSSSPTSPAPASAAAAVAPRLLHISRYMYHAVTLVKEASLHLDVAHIQPYLNNGHRVLYLDRSRQAKSRLAPNAASCTVCSRTLQHPYLFCSLRCKLAPNTPSLSPPVGIIASKSTVNASSSPSSSAARGSKTPRPAPKSALPRTVHLTSHHHPNDIRHPLEGHVGGVHAAAHRHHQQRMDGNASAPQSPATTAPGTPRCCTPSGLSPAVSPPSPPPMGGGRKRDRERAARRAAAEEKKADAATAAVVAAVQAQTAAAAAADVAAADVSAVAASTGAAGTSAKAASPLVGSRSNGPVGVSKKSRSKRKSRPIHSPAAGSKTFVLMRSNLQPLLL